MHVSRIEKPIAPAFAAFTLTTALQSPAAADTEFQKYVALCDSYASGPGVPTQVAPEYGRSDHNYAHVLAEALEPAEFTDSTCALLAFGEWWSNPCQKFYATEGVDQMEAKIIVAGYLRIVPDPEGYWPALPFTPATFPGWPPSSRASTK